MIRSGMDALRAAQSASLAVPVVYRRGGEARTISAVPGRTVFRVSDGCGGFIRTEARDFIVAAGELGFEPRPGDTVSWEGRDYEVLAPSGEPVWRWSDPFRTAMRIHTKHTGGET